MKVWLTLKNFKQMFAKIKAIFPFEDMESYFVPIGPGNRSVSGLLYNSFRARHDASKQDRGIIPKKRNVKKTEAQQPFVIPQNIDVIRQRLIHRSEPWPATIVDWKTTFDFRRKEIMSLKLAEVLKRWPKFQHKNGTEMIELDFECLYPGKTSILFEEWKTFSEKIMTAAGAKADKDKTGSSEDIIAIFSTSEDSPVYNISVL
ncbi:hypothetical protein ACFFRR_009656 [Megaselia abdita]